MKYDFYRCINPGCGRLITAKMIAKQGKCSGCGGRKMRVANLWGWNLPKIWEIPLIILRLR